MREGQEGRKGDGPERRSKKEGRRGRRK